MDFVVSAELAYVQCSKCLLNFNTALESTYALSAAPIYNVILVENLKYLLKQLTRFKPSTEKASSC